MGSFPGFLYRQITFKPKPLPPSVKLHGKTALVTGANVGLGLEACKELAAHGVARIILGTRSLTKGEEAKAEIVSQHPDVDVHVWEVDYESFDSVHSFAGKAMALDRLDIAILSAGVKSMRFTKSRTGHESNVQVNHLGTALLLASKTRLTIVSSENHFWVKLSEINAPNTLECMDTEESFGKGMDRYNASKLLNVLWMRELSARAGGNVIINAVNPGFCQSSLHRTDSSGSSFSKLIGWTAQQGGHCLTDAATQHADNGNGAYISEQAVKSPSPFVLSPQGRAAQTKIWTETIELLCKEATGVDLLINLEK
ncbi:NAD(P)-binding protein [Xylaria sp. FL0064]|nr:NAD(P)-binding protein [Xylaria sp. FL0064]